jgi:hypothetical protein
LFQNWLVKSHSLDEGFFQVIGNGDVGPASEPRDVSGKTRQATSTAKRCEAQEDYAQSRFLNVEISHQGGQHGLAQMGEVNVLYSGGRGAYARHLKNQSYCSSRSGIVVSETPRNLVFSHKGS